MKILITGATGTIGKHLAQTLGQHHQLVCCARNTQQLQALFPESETHTIDFSSPTPPPWSDWLQEVEVVINTVGVFRESSTATFEQVHYHSAVALFTACEAAGVRRVIQISALGAELHANTGYQRSKFMADEALRSTRLDWAIVAPSLVYSPTSPSMSLFRQLAALPIIPLPDQGEQCLQPVYLDDAIIAIESLVNAPEPIRAHIPLVGPQEVPLKTLLSSQRQWLGLSSAPYVSIPSSLLEKLLYQLEPFHSQVATRDSIRMLKRGNTAPANDFVQRFGWQPRHIDTVMAHHPASQAERWFYASSWVRPLLLLSIAWLWIFTGWVSLWGYPQASNLTLLASAGVPALLQLPALYGSAMLDILLGAGLLMPRWRRRALAGQLLLMALYSLILLIQLPEYWLHPFGPVTKNLPLAFASLLLLMMHRREK